MGTTHKRNQRNSIVTYKWVCDTHLTPDELFSSWLVRYALNQGCDPLTLTGELWPSWRVWAIDLDRSPYPNQIKTLTQNIDVPSDYFDSAFLKTQIQSVNLSNLKTRSNWGWLLSYGSRNRRHYGGLQFCPVCLSESDAYYKKQWRFAWHTVCVKHQCQLIDACPKCNSPIQPNLLEAIDRKINLCSRCKYDLSHSQQSQANSDILKFQLHADSTLESGSTYYHKHMLTTAEWFSLIRYFITLFRYSIFQEKVVNFTAELGIKGFSVIQPATGLSFELLPNHERAALLKYAWLLSQIDIWKINTALQNNRISLSLLDKSYKPPPSKIRTLFFTLPTTNRQRISPKKLNTHKPKSKKEVLRMYERLIRKLKAEGYETR